MMKRYLLLGLAILCLGGVFRFGGITQHWVAGLQGTQDRPIQLRIWDWWTPARNEEIGAYFEEVERIFEERNPDIDLVYQFVPFFNYVQKLSTALVGDAPPDLFQSSVYWAEGLFHRGMLRTLDDLLVENRSAPPAERITRDAFVPSAWRHNNSSSGKVFGIPQMFESQCLMWNLDLVEAVARQDEEIRDLFVRRADGSVDYDRMRFDAVRDWDHFLRITKKLTTYHADGSIDQAGFVINAYGGGMGMFSPWVAANGGRFQDADGTRAMFASANGIGAMEFMAKVYWEEGICPPFRREISDVDLFQEGRVACMVSGTWAGIDIVRNTIGWKHFAQTGFPPGPLGSGQSTVTWANMLVISQRCPNVEAAWRYLQFVCSLEGALLRLKHLHYNSPRKDLYDTPQWQQTLAEYPFQSNVEALCLVGKKLRHTEIIATDHKANPILETVLLRYPDIKAGLGPYTSVESALKEAAQQVDNVFQRYNGHVAQWRIKAGEGL
ncbi:MAG: extracellular solute-binding protein [bacterium]|nr:extracellular solute-binding protein [bacterium]